MKNWIFWFCICLQFGGLWNGHAELRTDISRDERTGWQRLSTTGSDTFVFHLDGSIDLQTWTNIAVLQLPAATYADPLSTHLDHRFYRFRTTPKTLTNDWKNQAAFPEEPFASALVNSSFGNQQPRWIKFLILKDNPTRVYFQHSEKFAFHYDFARQRLQPFTGMDRNTFDARTLNSSNQVAVLGAVLYSPNSNQPEVGIEFLGRDRYPIDQISYWFELVRSSIAGVERTFYFPGQNQGNFTPLEEDHLRLNGIEVGSVSRWLVGDHAYSSGWAIGRLKYFPFDQIENAYRSGQLLPSDILVTDRVPAEIPVLAGVISLSPSTPNSHVAILSRSFEIPFIYLAKSEDRDWIMTLVNHEIGLNAFPNFSNGESSRASVEIFDFKNGLANPVREQILNLKNKGPIQIPAKTSYQHFWTNTVRLSSGDVKYFGGKAANYSLLLKSIPGNTPDSIAFSFDLWDAFLSQTNGLGVTLKQQINQKLDGVTYPPNVSTLSSTLAEVRRLIRNGSFSEAQKRIITNALTIFDPSRKIRFRSSTNVEDSEQFTGAGLYDSYSGCLLDDHDGNAVGPSQCDPTEADERGVFRAIQRVYASFYNDNAFIERLRHGLSETNVAMGVLVHHSFPDEIELANGVAVIELRKEFGQIYLNAKLVTQKGATSVSNPDGSAIPETVLINHSYPINEITNEFGAYFELSEQSSLVPLGAYVLDWKKDYEEFLNLFSIVAKYFMEVHPQKTHFILDFEYKKDPAGLVVKQVREVPVPSQTAEKYFVIPTTKTFLTFQGEYGDVFANHRLKSRATIGIEARELSTNRMVSTFITNLTLEFLSNGIVSKIEGPITNFPGYAFHSESGSITDQWRASTNHLLGLKTAFEYFLDPRHPLQSIEKLQVSLQAKYGSPVLSLDYFGEILQVTEESVVLSAQMKATSSNSILRDLLVETNGVKVETRFYWPPPPSGISAGYTAPLESWVETKLTGLASQPIILHGYFSQTYRPEHHNFAENFIFEPRLEPGFPSSALNELTAANIAAIHVYWDGSNDKVSFIGLDGKIRTKK